MAAVRRAGWRHALLLLALAQRIAHTDPGFNGKVKVLCLGIGSAPARRTSARR